VAECLAGKHKTLSSILVPGKKKIDEIHFN
jgi:hypothetical protein